MAFSLNLSRHVALGHVLAPLNELAGVVTGTSVSCLTLANLRISILSFVVFLVFYPMELDCEVFRVVANVIKLL